MTSSNEARAPKSSILRVELTVRTALLAVLTVAGVWLFLQLWQVLLVIAVALMFVGMLNPSVEYLESRGVRRGWAIALVFSGLFGFIGAFVALTIPRLVGQIVSLSEHFPQSQARLATQLEASRITAPFAGWIRSLQAGPLVDRAKEYVLSYGPRAVEIIAYFVTVLFLALYIIVDRDRLRGALFALIPRRYHVRSSRVIMNLETIVGGYMRGQAITSGLMALFTFIVLMIAGVPNALALAIFAGLADVLPYIGALLACGPAFLVALSKGATVALIVLAILAAYQEFESRFIIPRVYGKVLRLPAATVMIALLVGGKLLGILGALLSLPIAAGIRMVVEELRVELPGEDIDDTELRQKDARADTEYEVRAAGLPAGEAAGIATEIARERHEEEAAKADDPRDAAVRAITVPRPSTAR